MLKILFLGIFLITSSAQASSPDMDYRVGYATQIMPVFLPHMVWLLTQKLLPASAEKPKIIFTFASWLSLVDALQAWWRTDNRLLANWFQYIVFLNPDVLLSFSVFAAIEPIKNFLPKYCDWFGGVQCDVDFQEGVRDGQEYYRSNLYPAALGSALLIQTIILGDYLLPYHPALGTDKAMWEEKAQDWDGFVPRDPNRHELSDPVLKQLLDPVEGKEVLDIGCGTGYLSRDFHAKMAKVTGIDFSPKMIELAKQKSDPAINFQVGSASKLHHIFGSNCFDKVFSNYVLMDCKEFETSIASMYNVLKPGGTAVIVILHPRSWCGDSYFKRHVQVIPPFDPRFKKPFRFYHRPQEEYTAEFEARGFEIVKQPDIVKKPGDKAKFLGFLLRKQGIQTEGWVDCTSKLKAHFEKLVGCEVKKGMTHFPDADFRPGVHKIVAKGTAQIKSLQETEGAILSHDNVYRGFLTIGFSYHGWTHSERKVLGFIWVDNVWNNIWPQGVLTVIVDARVQEKISFQVIATNYAQTAHPCRPDNFVQDYVCPEFSTKVLELLKEFFPRTNVEIR